MSYPKTLAELAVSTNPSPVHVLRAAADLTAEMRDYEYFEPMFAAAAVDAESRLVLAPVRRVDSPEIKLTWMHDADSGDCGVIDECPCTLGAAIRAALTLVNIELSAGVALPTRKAVDAR